MCMPMDNPRVPSDTFELAFFERVTGNGEILFTSSQTGIILISSHGSPSRGCFDQIRSVGRQDSGHKRRKSRDEERYQIISGQERSRPHQEYGTSPCSLCADTSWVVFSDLLSRIFNNTNQTRVKVAIYWLTKRTERSKTKLSQRFLLSHSRTPRSSRVEWYSKEWC